MAYNIYWNTSRVTLEKFGKGRYERVMLVFWKRKGKKVEEWIHKYSITIPAYVLREIGDYYQKIKKDA